MMHVRSSLLGRASLGGPRACLSANIFFYVADSTSAGLIVSTPFGISTPRRDIAIEFARHDNPGPATCWAMNARIDDVVEILGPTAHAPRPAADVSFDRPIPFRLDGV
ncbi:siderophore-interacting protein [Ferranicluibacter rubi]